MATRLFPNYFGQDSFLCINSVLFDMCAYIRFKLYLFITRQTTLVTASLTASNFDLVPHAVADPTRHLNTSTNNAILHTGLHAGVCSPRGLSLSNVWLEAMQRFRLLRYRRLERRITRCRVHSVNLRHPQNRKSVTYHNAIRGGLSHGHR